MIGRAVVVLLALAAMAPREAAPRQAREDERPGQGALAILRRDGLIFPFASFNNDRWTVTWPVDLRRLKIPLAFSAVPEKWWGTRTPDRWRARLMNGEEQTIEARNPRPFSVFCERRLGVQTTYQPSQPIPIGVDPFPKDGLAITGSVPIEPIEIVNLSSPEGTFLASALFNEFNRTEDRAIDNLREYARWRHPVPRDDRHKLPMRLEAWYRSPSSGEGWTVSYIEAVRQYPPGPTDQGCGLETLVSGWIFHENGALKSRMILRAKSTYCDRVGATYMLPLGRIRPKDRSYWVFQLSGWDDEWYEVAAVDRMDVRVVVEVQARGAMGCPGR
jgi:hypothetical protein